MNSLIIVAAQSTVARGDLDDNIAGHLRLIRVAASSGADLIVFPELSLTGYEMDLARGAVYTGPDFSEANSGWQDLT